MCVDINLEVRAEDVLLRIMKIDSHPCILSTAVDLLNASHQLVVCLFGEVPLIHRPHTGHGRDAGSAQGEAVAPKAPARMVAEVAHSVAPDCEHALERKPAALKLLEVVHRQASGQRWVEGGSVWVA